MSRRFRVALSTNATASVCVNLSSEQLAEIAENLALSPAELGVDDVRDAVVDAAFESTPNLCAHCTGWGNDDISMDLGDDWTLDDEPTLVNTSWVEPAVVAYFERVLPGYAPVAISQLTAELRAAATRHAVEQASRYPAIEEITDETES